MPPTNNFEPQTFKNDWRYGIAGSYEYGDETSGSGATELVS
jgi:hypothetical protein